MDIKNILLHLYWWQLKEYRLDRMLVHFKTQEGQKLFFNFFVFIKLIIILVIYLTPLIGYFLFIIFYSVLFIKFLADLLYRSAVLPKPTLRTWQTIALILVINFLLFWKLGNLFSDNFLALVILDIVQPAVVLVATLFLGKLLSVYKFNVENKARQKIEAAKNLTVVGITGSFGKTSTKEFLTHLLQKKFKVQSPPGHVNTHYGVAQWIVQNLQNSIQVLVVELGAYKKGEIAALCDMVKPKIGILTAIGNQHLALFGSIENIIQAKFELINSLPEDGLAILNFDNQYIVQNASEYHLKKIFYSTKYPKDIYAKSIKVSPENLSFDVYAGGQKQHISSKLLGGQNVPNLLAAFSVCLELGMNLKQIAKSCLSLKPAEATMEIKRTRNRAMLIDDTYNINPEGVKAALDYLKSYKNMKKITVLSPMIELGADTGKSHQEVEKKALTIVDKLFWTTQKENIKKYDQEGYVILFEGKNAKRFLEELI